MNVFANASCLHLYYGECHGDSLKIAFQPLKFRGGVEKKGNNLLKNKVNYLYE